MCPDSKASWPTMQAVMKHYGPAKVEFILHTICLVPLAYVLGIVLDWGLVGIWLAALLYAVLMAAAMVWKFAKGDWKDIEL